MAQNFFTSHKRFLIQVAALSFLIIMLLAAGGNTGNTFSEPYSRTDSLIDQFKIENRQLFSDTSLLQTCPELTFDLPEVVVQYKPTILIHSKARTTKTQLSGFLLANNPKLDRQFVNRIVEAYISDCALEGINHDIAISQMCLETGFLRFKGSVKANQFNFCGLGAVGKENSGSTFKSPEEGIRAHVQHLKAYANNEPLATALVDTRFAFVKRGIAPDVYSLSGTWASDLNYGFKMESIMRSLSKKVSTSEILANGI